MSDDLLARLRTGPPPALPRLLDRTSSWWWSRGPRARTAVAIAVLGLVLAAAGRGAVRSPWGAPVPVLVAAQDLPPWHPLTPEDVTTARWPAALVPPDAIGEPVGTLATGVPAGTPLSARHLTTTSLPDLVAGVAVPLDAAALPAVAVGDRVDVLAADVDGVGRRLAVGARVVHRDPTHVWLDVTRDEAAAIAGARVGGDLTLAVLGR